MHHTPTCSTGSTTPPTTSTFRSEAGTIPGIPGSTPGTDPGAVPGMIPGTVLSIPVAAEYGVIHITALAAPRIQ